MARHIVKECNANYVRPSTISNIIKISITETLSETEWEVNSQTELRSYIEQQKKKKYFRFVLFSS